MSIVYKSRILVVRFAKVFPFVLCFVVLISYAEGLYALANENYCTFDDSIVLYKLFLGLSVIFISTIGALSLLRLFYRLQWKRAGRTKHASSFY